MNLYGSNLTFSAVPPPAYFPGAGYPTSGYPAGPGIPPQMPGFKPFPDAATYSTPGNQSTGIGTSYAGYGTGDSAGGNLAFSDKTIRLGFIRSRFFRQFDILFVELLILLMFRMNLFVGKCILF